MTLSIGMLVPDFSLPDQQGAPVRLSEVRGSKNVVVAFYPFAFSGICTGEMCEIRDHLADLQNEQTAVLAVSCDPMFSLRAFGQAQGLTYPLLSDFWPHGEVARSYGVFDEDKGCATRGTFVIDPQGVLRWSVVNAIPDARDVDEWTAALAQLS
ncbi:MAG: peroxiredoxin [Actinomycetes bacterium]